MPNSISKDRAIQHSYPLNKKFQKNFTKIEFTNSYLFLKINLTLYSIKYP